MKSIGFPHDSDRFLTLQKTNIIGAVLLLHLDLNNLLHTVANWTEIKSYSLLFPPHCMSKEELCAFMVNRLEELLDL